MSSLYEKSLMKLELDQVLQLLAECAGSSEGRKACLQLMPDSDLECVQKLLSETSAAAKLTERKGFPGFLGIHNVTALLDLADRSGCLQPQELLRIAEVLRCTRTVKSYWEDDNVDSVLAPYFGQLAPNKFLEDRICTIILSEDEIADTASTELEDIRRHIRMESARVRDSLQKVISSTTYAKYLQEAIITIRNDRYVVPVKSEFKSEIPGMVHDISSTGSTCFVEPMAAVAANNKLRELRINEKKEIERILRELSADVAAHKDAINANISVLISLDVIFAKARLAYKMRAFSPEMNNQGHVDLHNARHPLIPQESVVPISIQLGNTFDTIIITGPNTGGKTVTLKTVGLLTLMAECGLHVPASEGSKLSTFDLILADIGDEQSIAQSLSTFSSHMRTIVDIVSQCDNRTLVLFDELGAGTDPAEGAALAIALIEHCRKMGSCVVATTHYAELKLYAMRTNGVINASCEFDVETLQPTYRLLIGVPGKSNAFAISKKLGLMDSILKDAESFVDQSDKDFDDVIEQLEQQRKQMESARIETERLREETERIKHQSEQFNAKLQLERDRALEQARLQAKQIIEDARMTANAATEEIKAIKKQLSETADTQGINQRQAELRRTLNEAENKLLVNRTVRKQSKTTRNILVGDTVELIKLGTKANVININKDGTFELQAGILKMNVKPDEVYLLEESQQTSIKARPSHSGREMKLSSMATEIDLRGMDSVEAICVLERYLDEAMRSNMHAVRIIHGKGTGVLRAAVQQTLRKNKYIKNFRLGVYGEGEDGVTIAEFI